MLIAVGDRTLLNSSKVCLFVCSGLLPCDDNLRYLWLFVTWCTYKYILCASISVLHRNTVNDLSVKIRVIRESEDLTRARILRPDLMLPIGTLRRYETGRIENIGGRSAYQDC